MASEFQGFARDLHNGAVAAIVRGLAPADPVVQTAVRIPYLATRRLDRGNADPASLGTDFGLLGMDFWAELNGRYPRRAPTWKEKLSALNAARNGIAHDDHTKVARMRAAGWPTTLRSVDRWQSALDGLAHGMDRAVGEHVRITFGVRPW